MNDIISQNLSQIINLLLSLLLIAIGWFFGTRTERRHLARLHTEELALADILVSSERFFKPATQHDPILVVGNVVIAQDRFKFVFAQIASLFGKNLTMYETLLDRARREALVRAKHQAKQHGCHAIYGLRFETSEIEGGVEVLAYGTAIIV